MKNVLLGLAASLAAISLPAAPAQAEDESVSSFVGVPAVTIHSGFGDGFGDRRDRRRHRGSDVVFFDDREWQGDSAWRSDGFNDWWHERPNRSHPAWLQRNLNCERIWWSGGGWRC